MKILPSIRHAFKAANPFIAAGKALPVAESEPGQGKAPNTANPEEAGCLYAIKKDHILTIFLNRPQVLNALDMKMAGALREQLQQAARDSSVRVVVITGRGRAFCSGGDLTFALQANPQMPGDSFQALTTVLNESIELIRHMPKPVIAAVNGPAAGAGMFLALACDIRLMAQTAYLKTSNTSYGLTLPASGTYTLPRMIGLSKALEISLLDTPVSAGSALAMGLITKVINNQSFYSDTEMFASHLATKAVHTLGQVKQLMYESFERSLPAQLAAEQQAIVQSANHAEGREGLQAFVEKRTPDFITFPAPASQ